MKNMERRFQNSFKPSCDYGQVEVSICTICPRKDQFVSCLSVWCTFVVSYLHSKMINFRTRYTNILPENAFENDNILFRVIFVELLAAGISVCRTWPHHQANGNVIQTDVIFYYRPFSRICIATADNPCRGMAHPGKSKTCAIVHK